MSRHSISRQMILRFGHTEAIRARRRARPILDALEDRTLLSHLTYHGGPTLANPAISAIYYGATWSSASPPTATESQINGFLGTIINSAYMDFLSSFDPTAKNVGGRGTLGPTVTVPTKLGATVEDHDQNGVNDPNNIEDMIRAEISAGKIPESSVVFVYVAPGTVVNFHDSDGSLENSVNQFRGYHSFLTATDGKTVYYAVMAYPTAPNNYATELNDFQNLTEVTSHELAEAVTDPDGQTGWIEDNPPADNGGEMGDLAANLADNPAPVAEGGGHDYGLLDGYVVQYEFANSYLPPGLTDNPITNAPVLPVDGFGLTGPLLPPLSITQILNPTTGSFSGTIATFEDSRPAGSSPTQYTAQINWGDGTTSAGTVVYDSASKLYDVIGSHAYTQAQGTTFAAIVSIADNIGGAASLISDVTLAPSAAGQLDPTFGYQGIVPLQFAANDVVSYPDGRFLVAGTGGGNYGGEGYSFPYVQRYTADGQLDPTFGSLGTAVDAANLGGLDVALEPDGKIVESVEYNVGAQLIRFNPDGSLDTTFGTSGATAPLSFNVAGQMSPLVAKYGNVAVLPDGRILLAGSVSVTAEYSTSVGLAMFNANGTLDPSFNGNGTLLTTPDPDYADHGDEVAALAVNNDKILCLISDTFGPDGIFLDQFNLDGSPDTTFGSGGVVNINAPNGELLNASLAVQPDGSIVIGYQVNGAETVARFNADGSPDQSFGPGGQTTFGDDLGLVGLPAANNIALQPNGKIIIESFFQTSPNGVQTANTQLFRLDSDGTPDASFGNDASVALPGTWASSVAVQPSGRILLAVGTGGSGNFELAGVVGDPVVTFGGATSVSSSSGTSTAVYDVSENAGSATITLERGGDLTQTLSVPFSTDDSGGLAGVNYTSVNTTVTFAVGSATAAVAIPILNDPNASAPIDVPLLLGTPSDGATLGNVAVGDLHIDPVEAIVITPTQLSSVMQGGAGSSFTVALQSIPTGNVTVPLSISTTSPAASLSTSTLVFTPANALTPQMVTVTAAGGSGSTPAIATVSIGLATSTDPKYNGLAGGDATVGVYANATSPGSIEFAAANFTDDENAGTAQITLVRLGGSSGSVSVHFATSDGTYGADGKYTPLSGSISFGAGVTSKTITITLIDPGYNLQGDQIVDLTLSSPTGGAQLGVLPTATLTLHDTSELEAGDLDPTFGTDGESILPDYLATPSAIASQSNGDLVIAGTGGTTTDGTPLVRVWRTNASGQSDPSFGEQGLALIPFPNFVQVKGVSIGPDGKIVVVATATKPAGGNEFALLRLNADGSLDTGFGSNGLVTTSFSPGDDMPIAVFVESDDSIYVAGTVDTASDAAQPFAFTHYGPDGSVDIGFGDGGAMVIPAVGGPAGAVLEQPDGKWLVIAGGGYDANSGDYLPGIAVRLNPDFTPDSTFGTAGVATLTWSEFYSSAALQPDGKILIGGGEATNGLATLGRLNADGSLDTTFGSGGSVSTVFNVPAGGDFGITSSFSSVIVQSDSKIVAIGSADDVGAVGGYFTAEARYNNDGSPDTSFADGGSRWFSIGGDGNDYGAGAVALPNGDIAIAATSDNLPVLASILTAGTQITPTITWADPATIVYGTALGSAQLDATASVPGTFAYSPAAGTVLDAGNDQTLSVTFMPTDATAYTTATATANIDVAQATPTITWANPADIVHGTPLGNTQLDATSPVAGTFTYTPAGGTVLNAGPDQELSVTFTPTDATDYTSATDTVQINVSTKPVPKITWANPADIVYGTALGATQLDATASVAGTFAYSPAAGTILHAGNNQTLSVIFTPTDNTDYTDATATAIINVAQATPTVTWILPAGITAGTTLGPIQLDATANVPGTFTYTPSVGTVIHAGDDQTLSASFTPTDTIDYVNVNGSVNLNVPKATPTITWADPADITFGTPLSPVQLDASASVAGTFTYTPAAQTTLKSGPGQALSVTFTPTDAADYNPVTTTTTINVLPSGQKATPIITWADPAKISYGTALGAAQLDATAAFGGITVAGTFSYTLATGTVLNAGAGQTLSVGFTPEDTTDYTSTSATAMINVAQATPTIMWAEPAAVIAGTPLSAALLDATASVPGVFTYSPAAGAVLTAGANQPLTVTFTPSDTRDYTVATGSTAINVIAVPTPPHVAGIVGMTQTKKGLTAITVGFDEAMDSGSVGNRSLYSVFGAVKKRKKTVYTKGVAIKGISFDGKTHVTINFAKPYKGAVQLKVLGGIMAADGASSNVDFSAVVD